MSRVKAVPGPADTSRVATVLVCDDQPVLRDLVRGALSASGHEIVEAGDADDSLRLARELRPDVVILDLVLPGRSGLDVLADLRRDQALADTRVILCSAGMSSIDRNVVASFAADCYLPKPFSPLELASIVDDLVSCRR